MDGIIDCPSPNFDERDQPVSIVVLHYTGMADGRLRDRPAARSRGPGLVPLSGRRGRPGAAHGRGIQARLACRPVLLARHPQCERGQHRHRDRQSRPRIWLSAVHRAADGRAGAAARRHHRPPPDSARQRRRPFRRRPGAQAGSGRIFDWALLARHKLAVARPTKGLVDPLWTDGGFLLALERYGYDVRDALAATVAFQRRFRPELIDGTIDGECRAILLHLLLDRERGHLT